MSFFDFIFPEQAQASHLRRLANQGQEESAFQHRERLAAVQKHRLESSLTKSLEQRIERLERELGEAGLVVEALLELLEQGGVVSRSELAMRTAEIDSRDGIVDRRITPPEVKPFEVKRPWPKEEA
jgi:hypothetical protein